jgi:hypothetical protein
MARIFINFRNLDGDWAALAIRNTLVERFGANEIFLSSFSIQPGADFAAELLSRASECDVLLAVIGPRWLTMTGPDGRSKLGAPDDWVCREIETAFDNGRTVVPIILSGADRLREAELPPRIARLAGIQGCRLDRPRYATDIGALEEALMALIPGLNQSPSEAPGIGVDVGIKVRELKDATLVGGSYAPGTDPKGRYAIEVDEAAGSSITGVLMRGDSAETTELSRSRRFLFPFPAAMY